MAMPCPPLLFLAHSIPGAAPPAGRRGPPGPRLRHPWLGLHRPRPRHPGRGRGRLSSPDPSHPQSRHPSRCRFFFAPKIVPHLYCTRNSGHHVTAITGLPVAIMWPPRFTTGFCIPMVNSSFVCTHPLPCVSHSVSTAAHGSPAPPHPPQSYSPAAKREHLYQFWRQHLGGRPMVLVGAYRGPCRGKRYGHRDGESWLGGG